MLYAFDLIEYDGDDLRDLPGSFVVHLSLRQRHHSPADEVTFSARAKPVALPK